MGPTSHHKALPQTTCTKKSAVGHLTAQPLNKLYCFHPNNVAFSLALIASQRQSTDKAPLCLFGPCGATPANCSSHVHALFIIFNHLYLCLNS